ncbi:MAG: nitrilase-related carbon-nitrogen hydrolase [Fusobacteriaceae bacterium]
MKLCLAQMKPNLGDVEKNLLKMIELIKESIEKKVEIIVFPELALTGYLLEDLIGHVAIKEVPKELLDLSEEISIIFGAVELGNDGYIYNSAYYLENGEMLFKHRKVYLPTYGMFDEGRYFKEGNEIKAFNTKHGRFGILICEDMWHPTSSFILAQDGAQHIFALVSSPGRGLDKELEIKKEWESLIHAAAISNTVFVTMVNRTGVEDGVSYWGGSQVVAPTGEKLAIAPLFEEKYLIVEIKENILIRSRLMSPVAKNENLPLILKELKRIWRGNE